MWNIAFHKKNPCVEGWYCPYATYLSYDNKLYMLPDSDLGTDEERVCDFMGGFDVSHYEDTDKKIDLYTVKTTFRHKDLNKQYDIMITLTNQEVNEETTDTSMDEPGD